MNYFSRTCFTSTTRKLKHKDTFKNVWTLSKLYLNSALTVFNGCRWHNSLKWSFMQKSQSIRHISLCNVIIPPENHKGIFKQMQWVLWVPYHPLLWIFMNSKIRAITLLFFFSSFLMWKARAFYLRLTLTQCHDWTFKWKKVGEIIFLFFW